MQNRKLIISIVICVYISLLNGCYSYTQAAEDFANREFLIASLEYSSRKTEENIIRARRDKFEIDGDIAAANREDSLFRKYQINTNASKVKYEAARLNAMSTKAGNINLDSPICFIINCKN